MSKKTEYFGGRVTVEEDESGRYSIKYSERGNFRVEPTPTGKVMITFTLPRKPREVTSAVDDTGILFLEQNSMEFKKDN